jgi:hypothetical protein
MGKIFNPFYRIIAIMQEQHLAHKHKCSAMLQTVHGMQDIRARSALFKIYKNCSDLYTQMDKEMVNCRRLGRVTLKYTELEAKYADAINVFDQWTVMATLMF